MEKDIPLKVEIFHGGDNDKHRIISAQEIKFILNDICKNNARVALYYGNRNEFILTTLLGTGNTGLWLEKSPSELDNQRVIESDRIIFVSSHLQIKVQFTANRASSSTCQGIPAFHLRLPDSIYRLQRREHYRLTVPASELLRCVITAEQQPLAQPCEIIIMDISVGGVGLTCAETDIELTPGVSYPDCRINLPGFGTIIGTIEVKNLVLLASASGHPHKRAGCEFKNLDGRSTILIQRYVTDMQRKNRT